MPNSTCSTCGEDYTRYYAHFIECDARGCGEAYCPSLPECPYCSGSGYDYDEYDDEYDDYDSRTGIYSYDYKPEPVWFGGRSAPYYLGFELEISASEYGTSPIDEWCSLNGHPGMLYCKEDGSVEGFEIVSHPMTPEYFEAINWPSFFAMLEENWPCGDEPFGHGLHVHVSRTAFEHTSTLARWSYLLNTHPDHVNRVARRAFSHWAKFTDYPVRLLLPYERQQTHAWWEDGPALPCGCCHERVRVEEIRDRATHQVQSIGYPDRYSAVNLTNDATVEVRVFKSTRSPEEFVSSLHFVIATVEFVRSMQPWHATRESLAWDRFSEYVRSHPVFSKESHILTGSGIPAELVS